MTAALNLDTLPDLAIVDEPRHSSTRRVGSLSYSAPVLKRYSAAELEAAMGPRAAVPPGRSR